jgi:hypothetical protein
MALFFAFIDLRGIMACKFVQTKGLTAKFVQAKGLAAFSFLKK